MQKHSQLRTKIQVQTAGVQQHKERAERRKEGKKEGGNEGRWIKEQSEGAHEGRRNIAGLGRHRCFWDAPHSPENLGLATPIHHAPFRSQPGSQAFAVCPTTPDGPDWHNGSQRVKSKGTRVKHKGEDQNKGLAESEVRCLRDKGWGRIVGWAARESSRCS